jgi:hypothetical protein
MNIRLTFVAVFVVFVAALVPAVASAMCYPFGCPGCQIRAQGQITLVRFDRAAGLIHMVPNIRVAGTGDALALVVPTAGLPTLSPADVQIWNDAFALTGRRFARQTRGGCGANLVSIDAGSIPTDESAGGVTIHGIETVGAFEATIVTADTVDDLGTWLIDRGFAFTMADEAAFRPLVEDGWFFTAMTLAPGTKLPPSGWDRSVDPVRFTYEADTFVAPRQVLIAAGSIGSFFVIDDHRMALTGFDTEYANQLNVRELEAIREEFPAFSEFVREGVFITRLDRDDPFNDGSLEAQLELRRVSDRELVPVVWSGAEYLALLLVSGAWSLRARRRRRIAA